LVETARNKNGGGSGIGEFEGDRRQGWPFAWHIIMVSVMFHKFKWLCSLLW
jgi:hypothetical protein